MAQFQFDLVAPERVLFSGPVDSVVVPGEEGAFQVLAQHAPLISTLKPGLVVIAAGGAPERLFVRGGFAEVRPDGLTILAEGAVALAEVDAERLASDIRKAEEDVADAGHEEAATEARNRLNGLLALRAALAH